MDVRNFVGANPSGSDKLKKMFIFFVLFSVHDCFSASSSRLIPLDTNNLIERIKYLSTFSLKAILENNLYAYNQIEHERNHLKLLLCYERLRQAERDAVEVMVFLGNQ